MRPEASPLASFWAGGFEGADHINFRGDALDLQQASGHLERLDQDYRRAAEAGLFSIRESIGWRLCEAPGGRIDLSRVERIAHGARRHGLQPLWTIWHYGLPADLSLHDDALIARFARFAAEVARLLKPLSAGAPVYTPVNEIGYLAWAASQPQLMAPPNNGAGAAAESSQVSGYRIKRRLARAALAAIEAIRAVDARARFLHVEPLCHVVAPPDRPDLAERAAEVRGWQWQAWDLLAGRLEPALGGSPAALDLLGVNHYHSSQWELLSERRLAWHLHDPRWLPLGRLLDEAWRRYGRPLVIAETGHVGAGRADWLNEMAAEALRAREQLGLPLWGFCLYPLVDRPDWNEPARWHESGLWQVDPTTLERRPVPDYLQALRQWQQRLSGDPRE
ncbi:family 1 glycosylhydrolase [Roseateles violae]|uniref:Family 1 glycosylhydrolase n=1 Tax=Roseateles violae TaxID=3058042 RepID=A0ABT8DW10_9BURK|nr:family 1 glycosylhydrolase [Pelomonas sp. PFR6]MDN3922343.1 family 1 glycosylhydrolase [Pelomonas sp. PFR6]